MMLGNLDKIFCTCIGKQVHPFLRIPRIRREILDEVVIHNIRTVCLVVILVCLRERVRPSIKGRPIPISIIGISMTSFVGCGDAYHSA